MDGLSHWLRQIIAVVLLVSIVDLILPNRTMQKYVRLVAGLFIIMTVATPVMNWVKGDFNSELAESLSLVEQSPVYAADELAMIEIEGAKLRERQSNQAADMVTTKLKAAIASEVEQSEKREVQSVDVQWQQEADGSLSVEKVVILLDAEQIQTKSSESSSRELDVEEVSLIDPVAIDINVKGLSNDQTAVAVTALEAESGAGDGIIEAASSETNLRVTALLVSQFGIAARNVVVKQLQDSTTKPK